MLILVLINFYLLQTDFLSFCYKLYCSVLRYQKNNICKHLLHVTSEKTVKNFCLILRLQLKYAQDLQIADFKIFFNLLI